MSQSPKGMSYSMNKHDLIIGIDPDMRGCGVCRLVDGKIVELSITPTHLIFEMFLQAHKAGYVFVIEDVDALKPTFNKGQKKTAEAQQRKAQNVGMVKASKIIMQQYLLHYGCEVYLAPAGVGKQLKNNAKLFKEITGYEGSTNEDKRDAYSIAKYAHEKLKRGELKKVDDK